MYRRTCINHHDKFRYICGKVTLPTHKSNITPFIKKPIKLILECSWDININYLHHIYVVNLILLIYIVGIIRNLNL